jgi:hypothetical protein
MTNPWDRQTTETEPAWLAFSTYRDLRTHRSIQAALKASGRKAGNKRLFEGWSSRHDWASRAAAWDVHLDQAVQARIMKERGEMAARQVRLGQSLQEKATEGLKALQSKELEASDVAALAKAGAQIERVAMGEPTEIQQHTFARETRGRLRDLFGDDGEAKA